MKITRRKLRDLILQEAMIKAGQIRFNLDVDKLANKGYNGEALPNGPNPTAAQMSALRGAMILRALIETTSESEDPLTKRSTSSLVASVGEEIAAAILGGVQFNSSWLGGDDSVFVDVKAGDTYWSVKLQAKGKKVQKGKRSPNLPTTKLSSLYQATQIYGAKNFGSIIIIFQKGNEPGSGGIQVLKSSSKSFKSSDFEKTGDRLVYKDPNNSNNIVNTKNLENKETLKKLFGIIEEIQYEVASEDEIISSLRNLGEKYSDRVIDLGKSLSPIEDLGFLLYEGIPPGLKPSIIDIKTSWEKFKEIIGSPNISASEIVKLFPFFGKGLGAASQRSDRFISSAGKFMSGEDTSGSRRNFVYKSSRLFELMSQVMDSYAENPMTDAQLNTIIDKIDALVNDLNTLNSET